MPHLLELKYESEEELTEAQWAQVHLLYYLTEWKEQEAKSLLHSFYSCLFRNKSLQLDKTYCCLNCLQGEILKVVICQMDQFKLVRKMVYLLVF